MEENTETKQEETQEEKLLAGKYKSTEDLEKAYKEAEKKMHESNTKKAEMEARIQELETLAQQAQKAEETNEETEDISSYEYLTKADLLKELKKQEEKHQTSLKQVMDEFKTYVQGTMEVGKIRSQYDGLSDRTIQTIINSYPDEPDFDSAYKKYREDVAKELRLNTETKVTTKEVNIPSRLGGTQDIKESEDRSRIERIKQAGTSGKLKLEKR
jgi:hypothetical protein